MLECTSRAESVSTKSFTFFFRAGHCLFFIKRKQKFIFVVPVNGQNLTFVYNFDRMKIAFFFTRVVSQWGLTVEEAHSCRLRLILQVVHIADREIEHRMPVSPNLAND